MFIADQYSLQADSWVDMCRRLDEAGDAPQEGRAFLIGFPELSLLGVYSEREQ